MKWADVLDEIMGVTEEARSNVESQSVSKHLDAIDAICRCARQSENQVFVKSIEKCPFCGNAPCISASFGGEGWRVGIVCDKCVISPRTDDMISDTFEEALAVAIDQWNSRNGGSR